MPYVELRVYVEQLDHWISVMSSGAFKAKGQGDGPHG